MQTFYINYFCFKVFSRCRRKHQLFFIIVSGLQVTHKVSQTVEIRLACGVHFGYLVKLWSLKEVNKIYKCLDIYWRQKRHMTNGKFLSFAMRTTWAIGLVGTEIKHRALLEKSLRCFTTGWRRAEAQTENKINTQFGDAFKSGRGPKF